MRNETTIVLPSTPRVIYRAGRNSRSCRVDAFPYRHAMRSPTGFLVRRRTSQSPTIVDRVAVTDVLSPWTLKCAPLSFANVGQLSRRDSRTFFPVLFWHWQIQKCSGRSEFASAIAYQAPCILLYYWFFLATRIRRPDTKTPASENGCDRMIIPL